MRVLFCKIHCPFICFWKPSSHSYTPGTLTLDTTPHEPPFPCPPGSVHGASDESSSETTEVREEDLDEKPQQVGNLLKSILRKAQPQDPDAVKEVAAKRVQWMDFLGKELVQIKEFESREIGDPNSDTEDGRSCLCLIL